MGLVWFGSHSAALASVSLLAVSWAAVSVEDAGYEVVVTLSRSIAARVASMFRWM